MANKSSLTVSATNERVSASAHTRTTTLVLEQEADTSVSASISTGGSRWAGTVDELVRIVKAGLAAREAAVDTLVRDGDEDGSKGDDGR